jgi:hypothetical protein
MGFALAAELNGYPGPRHTLDFADQLGLSEEQRAGVQRLFDEMAAEAASLGEKLIAQEAHLDRLFAERTATVESLRAATAAIGETQGALRQGVARMSPAGSSRPGDMRVWAHPGYRPAPQGRRKGSSGLRSLSSAPRLACVTAITSRRIGFP